ncbi:protein of unknown function [uncultured Sphingopyxis sp.]|uniref:Uncharacterized protein n=1 Tax=uncultured Sphingopyxis sp. TaxID=310581 RepID=A0A1Y5PWD3_9SPHN|nr:protein of unknown function [uncultured Sphingopyxis sp.]
MPIFASAPTSANRPSMSISGAKTNCCSQRSSRAARAGDHRLRPRGAVYHGTPPMGTARSRKGHIRLDHATGGVPARADDLSACPRRREHEHASTRATGVAAAQIGMLRSWLSGEESTIAADIAAGDHPRSVSRERTGVMETARTRRAAAYAEDRRNGAFWTRNAGREEPAQRAGKRRRGGCCARFRARPDGSLRHRDGRRRRKEARSG